MLAVSTGNLDQMSVHIDGLRQFIHQWTSQQEQLLQVLSNAKPASPDDVNLEFRGPDSSGAMPDTVLPRIDFSKHSPANGSQHSLPQTTANKSIGVSNSTRTVPSANDFFENTPKGIAHWSNNVESARRSLEARYNQKHVLLQCLQTHFFDKLCVLVILANAFILAWEADLAIKSPGMDAPWFLKLFEVTFLVFYAVEMAARIWVDRSRFFTEKNERSWNWFDLMLVIQGVVEQVVSALSSGGPALLSNISFLRIFRLMKVLKVLRVVRLLRAFRELKLILSSLAVCMTSMLWALLLMLGGSFLFGMIFLTSCINYLAEPDNVDDRVVEGIRKYWSSVLESMHTLFICTMGGEDWSDVAEPLRHISWWVYCLFLFYIALFAFVVMNIVTSMFLESVLRHGKEDEQLIVLNHLESEHRYVAKLERLYKEMDADEDGKLSYDEFKTALTLPTMLEFLTTLEIEMLDADHIFKILSDTGKMPVDLSTFVTGCIKMKGTAKGVDTFELAHIMRRQHQKLQENTAENLARSLKVERDIKLVLQHLQAMVEELPTRVLSKGMTSTWKRLSL